MSPRLYLDANIFIYAFENADETSERLRSLIAVAMAPRHRFLATSELTLAEIAVAPLRKGNRQLIETYEAITIGNSFIHVGTVSRDVLWLAAVLRSGNSRLRLPDAIHISTAMQFGCDYFLSGDFGLNGTYSVSRELEWVPSGLSSVSVVRPEKDTIERLAVELSGK